MTENENYVQGQEIEPISDTRVYVHKDVLKYLDLYQELGTIPQLRALNDERDKYLLMCREYSAIGTVEELQKLKGVITDFPLDCGSPIKSIAEIWNQLKKYLAIGTIDEFKDLKEKNVARNPIERKRNYLTVFDCPTCNSELYSGQRFCDECGQSISDDYA